MPSRPQVPNPNYYNDPRYKALSTALDRDGYGSASFLLTYLMESGPASTFEAFQKYAAQELDATAKAFDGPYDAGFQQGLLLILASVESPDEFPDTFLAPDLEADTTWENYLNPRLLWNLLQMTGAGIQSVKTTEREAAAYEAAQNELRRAHHAYNHAVKVREETLVATASNLVRATVDSTVSAPL